MFCVSACESCACGETIRFFVIVCVGFMCKCTLELVIMDIFASIDVLDDCLCEGVV